MIVYLVQMNELNVFFQLKIFFLKHDKIILKLFEKIFLMNLFENLMMNEIFFRFQFQYQLNHNDHYRFVSILQFVQLNDLEIKKKKKR